MGNRFVECFRVERQSFHRRLGNHSALRWYNKNPRAFRPWGSRCYDALHASGGPAGVSCSPWTQNAPTWSAVNANARFAPFSDSSDSGDSDNSELDKLIPNK